MLYVSAAALMIWSYKDKKVENTYGEFMCSVLGTNLILIGVISLVFFGQQRYLVYNFRNFLYILFPAAYAAVEAIWAQSGSKALGAAKET